ncbi:MAG: sulfur carrier protein ThiS [Phycisphaerae bacterium]|nr:sulfur carrier protein ThiS [Phycisphaerae bacterium]
MKIVVNGKEIDVGEARTVSEVLSRLGLDVMPCAVEVNLMLVPKSRHAVQSLHDGDRMEVVTLVGGG